METPHTNHLSSQVYENVYEPAEDTFLLLDALEMELPWLQQQEPHLCVEIGAGSGVVITALATKLHKTTLCLATDINGHACRASAATAAHNAAQVDMINCNLVDALRRQTVDVLIFNPPYVVTSDEELMLPGQSILARAWAGGEYGRRVIDDMLLKLDSMLSPSGVFYLLLLRENKPDEVMRLLNTLRFKATKIKERRIPGEYLYILKVTRQ